MRLESHLDLIPDDVDPEPAREHVERVLTARLAGARGRALAMLDSKRYYDLQARLVQAADDPVTTAEADRRLERGNWRPGEDSNLRPSA